MSPCTHVGAVVTVGVLVAVLPILLAGLALWQAAKRTSLRAPLLLATLAFMLEALGVMLVGAALERGLDAARALPTEAPGEYTSRVQVEVTNVVTPPLLAWCGALLSVISTVWLTWRRSRLAWLASLGLLAIVLT